MSKAIHVPAALALVLLASCGGAPTPEPAATTTAAKETAPGNGFEVHVTLSDLASAQLAASGGSVVVTAQYFGYPTVAAQQRQLPRTGEPWLALDEREVALAGAGVARFPAVEFDPADLALVEGGAPQVGVSVRDQGAGGETSGEDGLLDCGMFQDALAVAAQAPVEVDCKLLAE